MAVPSRQTTYQTIQTLMQGDPDIYNQLNAVRDWVNAHFPDFELYLEDIWNEHVQGETHIEYILRSKKTYNETEVLGYDAYKNHQDAKHVWHLDDYQYSTWKITSPQPIIDLLSNNGAWDSGF